MLIRWPTDFLCGAPGRHLGTMGRLYVLEGFVSTGDEARVRKISGTHVFCKPWRS